MAAAVTTFTVASTDTVGTNIDVSHGGGFTGTAVVVIAIGRGTAGSGRQTMFRSIGFATSSSSRGCCNSYSMDANASARARSGYRDDACGAIMDFDFQYIGMIDFVSFSAGSFRVVVDDQFPQDMVFIALVLDATASPVQFISPAGTGDQTITVAGWEANATDQCLLVASQGYRGVANASAIDGEIQLGVAAGGPTPVNYILGGGTNHNAATTQTIHHSREGLSFGHFTTALTGFTTQGSITSWDTGGCTLNFSSADTATVFLVLPLKGLEFAVGDFLSSTSTGALTPISGLGFTPDALMLVSAAAAEDTGTTVTDHDRGSIGLQDASGVAAIAWNDQDNTADSEVSTYLATSGDIYNAVDSSGKYAGLSVALDSDGFTPTQNDADVGASFVWWLAVGAVGGGTEIDPGIGTETDTALATAVSKQLATGTAAETDSAQAVTLARAVAVGVSAETNTALATQLAKSATVGVATSAETAHAPLLAQMLASETDVALAPSALARFLPAGVATESDAALATALAKHLATGAGAETDTSLAAALVKHLALGVAAETDSALALDLTAGLTVATAAETDTALSLALSKTLSTGLATETDAALDVALTSGLAPGAAAETDTAVARSFSKALTGTIVATTAESALALDVTSGLTPGASSETDTSLALQTEKRVATAAAAETEVALALTFEKRIATLPSLETSVALALVFHRALATGTASEVDASIALHFPLSVGVATSTEAALALALAEVVLGPPGTGVWVKAATPTTGAWIKATGPGTGAWVKN